MSDPPAGFIVCAGSDAIGVHAVFGTGVAVGEGVGVAGLGVGVGVAPIGVGVGVAPPGVGVGVADVAGVAVTIGVGVGVGKSSRSRGVASFVAHPAETTVVMRSAVHEMRRAIVSRSAPRSNDKLTSISLDRHA